MAKKKRIKKMTLPEFKAWLNGIELIQPDDWCPTQEQWQMIRDHINGIIEEEKEVVVQQAPVQPFNQQNRPIMPQVPQVPAPMGPITSELDATPQSFVPAGVEISPEAKALLQGGTGGKIKTPNVDTSDGNYDSSFS